MAAVVGAHEQGDARKFRPNEIDDVERGFRIVDAERDHTHLAGARRPQHIEPRAVAVIDLEAEPGRGLDHLRIVVEGGDVDAFREQALRHDLAESAESDEQSRAAHAVEIVGVALAVAGKPIDQHFGQRRGRRPDQHGHGRDRGEQVALRGRERADRDAERNEHEGEFSRRAEHRAGAQRIAMRVADGKEKTPYHHDLQHGDHQGGGDDQPEIGVDHRQIDRHADAHEEQREQQAAKRLDIGFELVTIVRLGEQHAGQEGAERHRHADGRHQRRRAEHEQQRRRRHHLARPGAGQQAEKRIEQIASGHHHGGDRSRDLRHRPDRIGKAPMRIAAGREQRQQCQQRHHRHILEQQDGEGALAVTLLQVAALLENLEGDRGRRHGQRERRDDRAAPRRQAGGDDQSAENGGREQELRGAETEDRAPHRDQAGEFELEPDEEKQQHDAELRHRQDGLRLAQQCDPERADDDAGRQIGHDRGEPQEPRNRDAHDRRREQHERKQQEIDFVVGLVHRGWFLRERRAAWRFSGRQYEMSRRRETASSAAPSEGSSATPVVARPRRMRVRPGQVSAGVAWQRRAAGGRRQKWRRSPALLGAAEKQPRFRARASLTCDTRASGACTRPRAGNCYAMYGADLVVVDACGPAVLGAGRLRPAGRGLHQLFDSHRRPGRLRAALRARGALPGLGLQLSVRRERRGMLAQVAGAAADRGVRQRVGGAWRGRDRAERRPGGIRHRSRGRGLQERGIG